MDYVYQVCGVDNSSGIPCRAQADVHTDKQTDRCNWTLSRTLVAIQPAWDINIKHKLKMMGRVRTYSLRGRPLTVAAAAAAAAVCVIASDCAAIW